MGGKFGANEIWVSPGSPWPDYVFEKNYHPKPISELEAFLTTNKHLPNLPSGKTIESNAKYSVSEMLQKQLEKIEESYLYIIQLNKKIEELEIKSMAMEKLILSNSKK